MIAVPTAISGALTGLSPRHLKWDAPSVDNPMLAEIRTPGSLAQLITVAWALAAPSPKPREFLRQAIPDPAVHAGVEGDWDSLLSFNWTYFPIVRTYQNPSPGATLTWCMLGGAKEGLIDRSSRWPNWWTEVAGNDSVKACALALDLATSETGWGYFLWPILPNHNGTKRLTGSSLGLPLFLHAKALTTDLPSEHAPLLATGGISRDGAVLTVGDLTLKAGIAGGDKNGLHGLLCPADGTCNLPDSSRMLLRVQTLSEAWDCFVWSCQPCQTGQSPFTLQQMVLARDGLQTFLSLPTHPLWYLRSLQESGHLAKLKGIFFNDAGDRQIKQLSSILEKGRDLKASRNDERHRLLVGDFQIDNLQILSQRHPKELFELCIIISKYYSCQGATDTELAWLSFAEQFINSAWQIPEPGPLQAYVTSRNNLDINCYNFKSEACDHVRNASGYLLKVAELKAEHAGGASGGGNPEAGKILNTLAARAAYRGEFDVAIANCREALRFFGDEKKLSPRVHRHLAFVFLEQNNKEATASSLSRYLGTTGVRKELSGIGKYEQHLLARYYRQYPDTEFQRHCNDVFCSELDRYELQWYPGNLTCYNIGFIVQDSERRKRLWRLSAELASEDEATVRPMALLPLAALYAHRLDEDHTLFEQATRIVDYIRQSRLKYTHFEPLLQAADASEVLKLTSQRETELFPFDFR